MNMCVCCVEYGIYVSGGIVDTGDSDRAPTYLGGESGSHIKLRVFCRLDEAPITCLLLTLT